MEPLKAGLPRVRTVPNAPVRPVANIATGRHAKVYFSQLTPESRVPEKPFACGGLHMRIISAHRPFRELLLSGLIEAIYACLLIACALSPAFAQTFQTSAPHVILIDAATKSVLFEKDADA